MEKNIEYTDIQDPWWFFIALLSLFWKLSMNTGCSLGLLQVQ